MSLLESTTLRWCARVFGDDVTARIFAPLVADWQHEADTHASANTKAIAHARWIAALARTGLVVGVSHLVCWRVPPQQVRPVVRTVVVVTISGVAVFFAATLWMIRDSRIVQLTPMFALAMLAKVTMVAGPLALGPGTARLAGMDADPRGRRWMLAGLTAGLLIAQLGTVGWLAPLLLRSDQLAHPRYFNGEVLPGYSVGAMTITDLVAQAGSGSYWSLVPRNELATRLGWIVFPVGIAGFAWRLGSWSRRWRMMRAVTTWLLPAGLLLAPSWLVYSYGLGGVYGLPAAFLQFLPTALLLALAWWLGPADAEARTSTIEHSPEAR